MRPRLPPPAHADRQTLEVRGRTRTYWVAPPVDCGDRDRGPSPLLLAFHGLGSFGSRMARWTGLDSRGPRAGFHCVFPDALDVWDDHGCGHRDGGDDDAFVAALIEMLARTGAADPNRIVLAGVSSGATYLERIVRNGVARVVGMALVAGTARVASSAAVPIAAGPTATMFVAGTDDPLLPYEGGLPHGPMGRHALRLVRKRLVDATGHESEAPERLAAEWASVNGCSPVPSIEAMPRTRGEFAIDRLTWEPGTPEGPGVVLHKIHGGGHGWPGGRQYLPARLIGRIPQHLDGTGLVLNFARAAVERSQAH
jgi:polyhydroxybutyrate depolymerase